MTISLGCHDADLPRSEVAELFEKLQAVSGNPDEACLIDDTGFRIYPTSVNSSEPFSVAELQTALTNVGFFPSGRIDGICGYRTRSAIRLFQEYVRTIEDRPCEPDGKFGPGTARELRRWLDGDLTANWQSKLESWQSHTLANTPGEFNDWLSFLGKVKTHRLQSPGQLLKKVEGFGGRSDTRATSDWSFDDRDIHLIGIRRERDPKDAQSAKDAHRFNDTLILLIKGLVFAFQGSTDPGTTENKGGAPVLVPGQHLYRFGLHQGSYHALRPLKHGVLILRAKENFALTESDFAHPLEPNSTINIHWGGRGAGRYVNTWSAGCQVVAGAGYVNHAGSVTLCPNVALNNTRLRESGGKLTRGAYNVLADLVIALSNDMRNPGGLSYTLLHEEDLDLDSVLKKRMGEYSEAAKARFGEAG